MPSMWSVGNAGAITLVTTSGASADSGPKMIEAKRYTKWLFTLDGTFTGYSVAIYGTNDILTSGYGVNGPTPTGTNWFLLPGESVQGGTGVEANPLTSIQQSLSYDRPLLAVRAVVTGTGQTGTVSVLGFATP